MSMLFLYDQDAEPITKFPICSTQPKLKGSKNKITPRHPPLPLLRLLQNRSDQR